MKTAKATKKYNRRSFLISSTAASAGILLGWELGASSPLVQVFHVPKCFSRRSGELTANLCGSIASQVNFVKYKINNSQWLQLRQSEPRVPPPLFTIELKANQLHAGTNYLEILAGALGRSPETTRLRFDYDPKPVHLPVEVDWAKADLDVQDGYWETFPANGSWRVRPKPGFEGYDRILVATGAFPGGRRIETDLIFRQPGGLGMTKEDYGFGIVPLWGGHNDKAGISPRRGWSYGLTWFYAVHSGIGAEFSHKYGDQQHYVTLNNYRKFQPQAGIRYLLTAECWPETNASGHHIGHKLRMKWWSEAEAQPNEWIELNDVDKGKGLLPSGEYAVALLAHKSQVEFGPVKVTPL